MRFIQGTNRHQLQLFSLTLDEAIDADNETRIIDAFVNQLDLQALGFNLNQGENGRPAYHPSDLLKLYIYGYLNRMRSSRQLEKECHRNIEVIWLLQDLKPDHNTIANFRRDHHKAIRQVFRQTVKFAKYFELIGGALIAGDSTKLRAQNSKKNNYNLKKIERHLAYIDEKLEAYNQLLAESDGDQAKQEEARKGITKHSERKEGYKAIKQQLEQSGETQISTSDPDSRHMITRNNITEVAYNIQSTVDAKHNLILDYKVTNQNDSKAMGNMLHRAKSILRHHNFTALYDKGYHTGSEFEIAELLGIKTLVAIPATPATSQAPDPAYNVANFIYDSAHNTYTCPQGELLSTNGTWHKDKGGYFFQQFKTQACKTCRVRAKCTKSQRNGKIVQRRINSPAVEANKTRVEANPTLYKRRQAIVEHPFGTIKRQWGFNYIMTKKGIERAGSDTGLIMIAYNLRRLMNIIGIKGLIEAWNACFYNISLNKVILSSFKAIKDSLPLSYFENKTKKTALEIKHNKLFLAFKMAA